MSLLISSQDCTLFTSTANSHTSKSTLWSSSPTPQEHLLRYTSWIWQPSSTRLLNSSVVSNGPWHDPPLRWAWPLSSQLMERLTSTLDHLWNSQLPSVVR